MSLSLQLVFPDLSVIIVTILRAVYTHASNCSATQFSKQKVPIISNCYCRLQRQYVLHFFLCKHYLMELHSGLHYRRVMVVITIVMTLACVISLL